MQARSTPGLVTVFGGSGFLGRYAVRALAKDGWRVRVALRRPHLVPELRVVGDVGQVELFQANVRINESVAAALEGADACVNLVGLLYESGRQTFQALHVDAARTIAEASAFEGIRRFVQVSAIGADPAGPAVYARTKAEGEAAVRAAIPLATILRPSVVFGEEDQFFNRFAAMAGFSPALPLIGGGKTLMQPVYVGDVAAAIAAAVGSDEPLGRTYELGGPGAYSFKALMEMMLHEIGRRRLLVPIPFKAAEAIGAMGELLARVGLEPPLTTDQVRLLKRDNVVSPTALNLASLGIAPTALESVLPTYLWKYRSGGQFAHPRAAAA
jgi:NADH dehydrogenase